MKPAYDDSTFTRRPEPALGGGDAVDKRFPISSIGWDSIDVWGVKRPRAERFAGVLFADRQSRISLARRPRNSAENQRPVEWVCVCPSVMAENATEHAPLPFFKRPDLRVIFPVHFYGGQNRNFIGVADQRPIRLIQKMNLLRKILRDLICAGQF